MTRRQALMLAAVGIAYPCTAKVHEAAGGSFGPVVRWPLIPIHAALRPDGSVMTYGTNAAGVQGAEMRYDLWRPWLGTGPGSHEILPNITHANIFCGAQSIGLDGTDLIAGGEPAGVHFPQVAASNSTELLARQGTIADASPLHTPRWYPTIVSLADGRKLILGGMSNSIEDGSTTIIPAIEPEVWGATRAWQELPTEASDAAFGLGLNWYYPRAWALPGTRCVVLIDNQGNIWQIDPDGAVAAHTISGGLYAGHPALPAVMYRAGKILALRQDRVVNLIDLGAPRPVVSVGAPIAEVRACANLTILADGTVFLNGGTADMSGETGAVYNALIWDPGIGQWSAAGTAVRPRRYHSTALLLPDGTVLTGGSGAPGATNELNAEIYRPAYLNGQRPVFDAHRSVRPGQSIIGTANQQLGKVVLVRTGAATHAFNTDQACIMPQWSQSGSVVEIETPADPSVAIPGWWMVFAFSRAGVPAIAPIIEIS